MVAFTFPQIITVTFMKPCVHIENGILDMFILLFFMNNKRLFTSLTYFDFNITMKARTSDILIFGRKRICL